MPDLHYPLLIAVLLVSAAVCVRQYLDPHHRTKGDLGSMSDDYEVKWR